LHFEGLLDDPGSAAAEVGTLVHEVVAGWHRNGFDRDAAVAGVGDWRQRFPRLASAGRLDEALAHVGGYCGDPRNQVRPVLLERPVSLALPPHETDPTGQPVILQGTLDQVRETPGGLRLFDLKTGRTDGAQTLDIYAYQVAAYCVMASELLGEPVAPGALIRSAGYLARGTVAAREPQGVFFHLPWGLDDCLDLLDAVRLIVANVRRGEVTFGPGAHCATACPARGLQECLPKWQRIQKKA
jgi:hypothetical protein